MGALRHALYMVWGVGFRVQGLGGRGLGFEGLGFKGLSV